MQTIDTHVEPYESKSLGLSNSLKRCAKQVGGTYIFRSQYHLSTWRNFDRVVVRSGWCRGFSLLFLLSSLKGEYFLRRYGMDMNESNERLRQQSALYFTRMQNALNLSRIGNKQEKSDKENSIEFHQELKKWDLKAGKSTIFLSRFDPFNLKKSYHVKAGTHMSKQRGCYLISTDIHGMAVVTDCDSAGFFDPNCGIVRVKSKDLPKLLDLYFSDPYMMARMGATRYVKDSVTRIQKA